MDITELLQPEQVVNLQASGKLVLLDELARRAARVVKIEAPVILDAVMKRERLGSTGVGQGIAVPHARVAGLSRFFALFGRLDKPIDFDAIDARPVDLVVLLLIPENSGTEHLVALAAIARCLRDQETARRLRAATDPKQLYDVMTAGMASKGLVAGSSAAPISGQHCPT
jgi:nitrogen PTS system EIIA component